MHWEKLNQTEQLEGLMSASFEQPVMIFKHSTRCPISSMALDRLERQWQDAEMTRLKPYFLDLISYRDVSNAIADQTGVQHQSPQLIMLKDGNVVYHTSHMGINYQQLKQELGAVPS